MKCAICDKELDPLSYSRIKIKSVSKIHVLDEISKHKETLLDLHLCNGCQNEIRADLVGKMLGQKKEVGCTGDCANCDGARI